MIIWIASYPKSGNTWMRMFLKSYFLKSDDEFKLNSSVQDKFGPQSFPQKYLMNDLKIDHFRFDEIVKNWKVMQDYINLNQETNFVKTHSAMCTIGPYKFTTKENTKGAIYLVRDPRDVLVSYSHHMGINYEKTYDLLSSNAFEYPIDNENDGKNYQKTVMGSWADHYNSWKNYKSSEILIIRYEDMLSDTFKTFSKVINYLNKVDNVEIDKTKILKSIEITKFDNLRRLEENEGFDEKKDQKFFFREGKTEVWKKDVDLEIIKKIEKIFKKEMTELGYLN